MNIEKMQSDFEAWALKDFGLREGHFVKGGDGEYLNYPTQCYFQVWQASRESLVIDLGKPDVEEWSDALITVHYGWSKEAIHATGVKTK